MSGTGKSAVKLYNYFRSSASWRVRIALNLKDIKYEYIPINLVKFEQKSEAFVKINPMKHVPALHIDNNILIESLPIIEYLEETRTSGTRLLPKDPIMKAKVRAFSEVINSGIQPLQNLKVLKFLNEQHKVTDGNKWIQTWVYPGFETLERLLKSSKGSGQYCFGNEITMADVFLAPQTIASEERFGVSLEKFPLLKEVHENLKKVKAFQDALPKNQPDFVQ